MVETMTPDSIITDQEKCTGCLSCQLICSYTYTGRFNPLRAYIRIDLRDSGGISFTEDCTECGLCVEQCPYGALQPAGKEDA